MDRDQRMSLPPAYPPGAPTTSAATPEHLFRDVNTCCCADHAEDQVRDQLEGIMVPVRPTVVG